MNGAPKRDTLEIIEDATFEEICNYDKTLDHAEARDLTSNIMNRVKAIITNKTRDIDNDPEQKLAAALKTIHEHKVSHEAINLVSHMWRDHAASGRVDFVNMTIGYLLGNPGLIADEAEVIRRDHADGCYQDDAKLAELIRAYEGRQE